MFADELAKMELKLKEQLKTNENLKLQLAAAEDRYKVRLPASTGAFKAVLSSDLNLFLPP